jgi:hypothetical protein
MSGVRGGVGPWHQLVDTGCGPEVDEFGERVGHPGKRIDRIQLARLHEGGDRRPVLGAEVMAGKERILAVERNLAVILPISGRMSPSTIAGIPCVGEVRDAFRSSGARRVSSYTSS